MLKKYEALVQRHRRDHVQQTHPKLGLVNPFSYPTLQERWNREFAGRLDILNDATKLGSRRLLLFYDYWHLTGLESDQAERDQGKVNKETPFERITPKLSAATGIDQWLHHNFVCFIKKTARSTARVNPEALDYCLPYLLDLIEAQETEVMGITNLDVLNLLMDHYQSPRFPRFRDAVFSEEPILLDNRFRTRVVPLYHPGHNGQMSCKRTYRELGLPVPERMDDLLISDWQERLRNVQ